MQKEQLIQLLRQQMEQTIAEGDKVRLAAYLQEEANRGVVIDSYTEMILSQVSEGVYEAQRFEPMLQIAVDIDKVANTGYKTAAHRVHFLKTAWFRYAAAVILVFGVAAYLWLAVGKRFPAGMTGEKHISNIEDVAPGREKAILTLANGKQIVLNNTQGNIVQQGNLKVTNLNGKLDYEGKSVIVEYHTLFTPRGGQYKIRLPDGTSVWLNAASSITYPTAFVGPARKVAVTGEAYFEVTQNVRMPFQVMINEETTVDVLGTAFNINAYENEATIKTTLLEGSVKMVKASHQQLLQPGEQAVASNNSLTVNKVNIGEVVAWKNGLFSFNGADLPTVMRQLERWYDIQVAFEGKITEEKFRGELPKDLKLSQVLETLKDLNVKFKIEGKKLIVIN